MLSAFIDMLGGVHYILQLACRWILFDKIDKSIVHERRLFQNRYVLETARVEFIDAKNNDNFRLFAGSLNLNPLAGKIMFRDVVFICYDYSLRVQDGYFIFRWWRSYVPKDVSEDLSHSDTRLSVMLNGFELHVYNRSELYAKLEKTFGLKPSILVPVSSIRKHAFPTQSQRVDFSIFLTRTE